jgi:GxxExxY protein
MTQLLFKEESYKIIGGCFNVYNTMGCGFLETVYQECLEIEFNYQGIAFLTQKEIHLKYRNRKLKQYYKPDFFC